MKKLNGNDFAVLWLRLMIACGYNWEVADRFGFLGEYGSPHVGWGDWSHFLDYAKEVMSIIPQSMVPAFAVIATILEGLIGMLLLVGLFTRLAAAVSFGLSLCFAICMALSFGIESPIGYSVFTLSAASLLLTFQHNQRFSLDTYLGIDKRRSVGHTIPHGNY